jgi:aspartyl-tRNA(Asn)/glutamyl-tRNA(Gln) amidotransferase subunit A
MHERCADAPRDARGRTLGVPRALLEGLSPEVGAALARAEQALVDQGAHVVDVTLTQSARALACYYVLAPAEASSNLMRYDGVRYGPRGSESRGVGAMVEATRDRFGPEVKRRIVLGTWVLSAGYHDAYVTRAQRMRTRITEELNAALTPCDALLMPTSPEPAWPLGAKPDPLSLYKADLFTIPASLAGLPAVSVPAARAPLPIGVQLVGRAFGERALLSLAGALEDALALPFSPAPLPTT